LAGADSTAIKLNEAVRVKQHPQPASRNRFLLLRLPLETCES
jgi:hypothetical protein